MKKIIFFGIIFIIFAPFMSLNAQWARTYGGYITERANSVQQTSDGGYIVAGFTFSFGSGWRDIWILKLSTNGDIEWQRTYGGNDEDEARSIQQTSDGGYIVTGLTYSFGAVGADIWILKLSTNGDIEWQRTYGGNDGDYGNSIQQTSDGGYIVAGTTYSFGAGRLDFWILKLSTNGDIEWQRTYGGSDSDEATSIRQMKDGGYVAAGSSGYDIWILKLSTNGDIEWQRTYGGSVDIAMSMQLTNDGGYIVAGYKYGPDPADALILKLSTNGDIEWQRTYGGSTVDQAESIHQTKDGGYIVAGFTYSFGAGSADIWILKLSTNGDIEWQRTYGGSGFDWAMSIQQTNEEGYIVVGSTESFGAGVGDVWVLKLFADGDIDSSCGFIESSDASIKYPSVFSVDTRIKPKKTKATPSYTYSSFQDTDANTMLLCKVSTHTLTISVTPGGTTDPSPGTYAYKTGTKVIIKAIMNIHYKFDYWSGDIPSSQKKKNPLTIKIGSNKNITAHFKHKYKPTPPKSLMAEVRSWNKIRLKWKDESNNEDGFKIFRRIGKEGKWKRIAVTKANVKTYLDEGLEENTFHRYRVRAFNSKGHSAYSNQAGARTKKKTS